MGETMLRLTNEEREQLQGWVTSNFERIENLTYPEIANKAKKALGREFSTFSVRQAYLKHGNSGTKCIVLTQEETEWIRTLLLITHYNLIRDGKDATVVAQLLEKL